MTPQPTVRLVLRSQSLTRDKRGRGTWQVVERERVVPAERMAIIVCDMWDAHWCKGAAERVETMAPEMNEVLASARDNGARIIHAPSETMDFYAGTPARERMRGGARVDPPPPADRPDPPSPIDDSDGGADTGEASWSAVWTRQHPALDIDQERDGVSDDGLEVYSFLRRERIEQTLIMGVHTNMCVLNRSFGIKRMVNWRVSIVLVRDLTDAMYNPARPPYLSHDEGTRLVVGYIEKFWCPTVAREQLVL
jgi:nicotinamidase-related amidase